MKHMRKLLAAACVLVLAVQTALIAGAAGPTYKLTLNNTGATEHTFDIYQIFTGDLSVNAGGDKVLANIVWGSGVTPAGQAAIGSASTKAYTLASESDAKDFAEELVTNNYLTGAVTKVVGAGGSEEITDLAPGYYLIKDRDATQSGENSAYTAFLLKIVGDVTASTKLDVPSVEKKVKDINDTADDDISDNAWQDSADHDIGDTIPYQLAGTLPGNYDEYAAYYYRFTDEMSAGLTYQADARVFVVNGASETEITGQATITPAAAAAGATLTVEITDLKAVTGPTIDKNSKIVVRYTAVLNNSAVVGSAGNPNTVYLTYSNDPNPGGSGTGTTPKDKAVVFTYQLVINKIDEGSNPLENAGFTLYKKDSTGTWQELKKFTPGTDTTFTFSGLDDGDYKLVESDVPEGYNKLDDIEFTITAAHDASAANPTLTSLCGGAEGDTITLSGTQQASVSLLSGAITASIMNKAGAILPSTGGIGTKLFYLFGSVLAVGAAVLLVTKKRMEAED